MLTLKYRVEQSVQDIEAQQQALANLRALVLPEDYSLKKQLTAIEQELIIRMSIATKRHRVAVSWD